MFGILKAPKRFQGTKKEMKISQGYNQIDKNFFIYITDKKSKITCRINMSEEDYQNFHNMGNFTYKQTKKDEEGEFTEEDHECCDCSDDDYEDYRNDLD